MAMRPQLQTQTPADIWRGLMAAKEIVAATNVSRSHWHSLVKDGKAPAPVLREARFTRWRASDILEWVSDPAAWIAANAGKGGAT